MIIDLRSDTVTKPTSEMRRVIAGAEVGDDSYGDDPSVNALESYCAELFGKEAAVFTTTGTMSNQLALRALTNPGDEVILDTAHHINYFESAQSASMAGVALNPIDCPDGMMTPRLMEIAIGRKPRIGYYSRPRLVCIENTVAYHGGKIFPLGPMRALHEAARGAEMAVYLDGARLLNACVAARVDPREVARWADLLSLDFAKGLGAPLGSILVGAKEVVDRVRKFRKWYGAGFHQAGIMAAAALYAVQTNVERLADDHRNARDFAAHLANIPGVTMVTPVPETNIVLFDVGRLRLNASGVVAEAQKRGVLLVAWTSTIVRAVTHLGVSDTMCRSAGEIVRGILTGASSPRVFEVESPNIRAVAPQRRSA
ncbi:MAG: threonine aldolase family protein [Polyangiaceae bacterium]